MATYGHLWPPMAATLFTAVQAMKESIVEELVPLRGDGVSDNDHFFDRGADQNTAPAVWVSPSKEKNREEKEKKDGGFR